MIIFEYVIELLYYFANLILISVVFLIIFWKSWHYWNMKNSCKNVSSNCQEILITLFSEAYLFPFRPKIMFALCSNIYMNVQNIIKFTMWYISIILWYNCFRKCLVTLFLCTFISVVLLRTIKYLAFQISTLQC